MFGERQSVGMFGCQDWQAFPAGMTWTWEPGTFLDIGVLGAHTFTHSQLLKLVSIVPVRRTRLLRGRLLGSCSGRVHLHLLHERCILLQTQPNNAGVGEPPQRRGSELSMSCVQKQVSEGQVTSLLQAWLHPAG